MCKSDKRLFLCFVFHLKQTPGPWAKSGPPVNSVWPQREFKDGREIITRTFLRDSSASDMKKLGAAKCDKSTLKKSVVEKKSLDLLEFAILTLFCVFTSKLM